MTMVVGEDGTAIRRGVGKHLLIGFAATSRLLNGQHVMSPVTQQLNRAPGEVFIAV